MRCKTGSTYTEQLRMLNNNKNLLLLSVRTKVGMYQHKKSVKTKPITISLFNHKTSYKMEHKQLQKNDDSEINRFVEHSMIVQFRP